MKRPRLKENAKYVVKFMTSSGKRLMSKKSALNARYVRRLSVAVLIHGFNH